jgi:branched-chain amino acid transport system permease protein
MSVVSVARPAGWYADSYVKDMRILATPAIRLRLVLLLVGLACYPLVASGAWVTFASATAVSVITVVGLQILMGTCGQVSVGQSAFMGIGAYAAAYAATNQGWPLPLAILFAAVTTTVVGVVFGLPAARIRGFYLALTTMAAQFVFIFTVPRLPASLLGGTAGLTVPRPRLFGPAFRTPADFYSLIIPITVVLVALAVAVNASQLGRQMVAVRENELAASVTGVRVTRTKIVAFAIASCYAGIAGALGAYLSGIAHFEQFTLFDSIFFLGYLVVGGVGSTFGAVVGTVALSLVREGLNRLAPVLDGIGPLQGRIGANLLFPLINVAFGVLIIVTLLRGPLGLAHVIERTAARVRRWPRA